ncbi:pre-mRNA-splicing factor ATP-dependent RNA helicase PRP43, partial [Aureobasidium pullulans]
MDDLEALEHLSLVSKVASEIQNHMGISDKTIAEFVIAQHEQCKNLDEFKTKLSEFDFSASLATAIDRLVLTMHPKYKSKAKQAHAQEEDDRDLDGERDRKTRVFKGLVIPDKDVAFDEQDDAQEEDTKLDAMDDTFALLEGLAGGPKKPSAPRKRSVSPMEAEYDSRQSKKSRRRTRSPEQRHDDFIFEDEFGRNRPWRKSDQDTDRKSRHRQRSRSEDRHRHRREPTPEMDDSPVLYKIYDGRVTGVKDFGVFVNLYGVRGKVDGLVHISAMAEGKVNHPSDLVSRNQEVKVKVMKVQDNRISLSMAEVDQVTGQDFEPHKRIGAATGANALGMNGEERYGNLTSNVPVIEGNMNQRRNRKRMTSPERWEIKQLIASGAISAQEYPDIDEDYNAALRGEEIEEEEDVDIEVRDEEPPFLAGQTKQSLELSPIRVVKAPDGSMNRAAIAGDVLAKERRDLKQQESRDKAAKENSGVDLQAQWNDPMANPEQRQFASDLRQARQNDGEVPEWKRIASHSKTQSFGKRTDMSIKDQRESLPAYQFRKQFLEAVAGYQLLIVVGDTGSGKTTQLTQYLAEEGYANQGMIGCTQPRRVAAMSVAQRVSEEVGCRLGEEVGYTIRFEDKTSSSTKIKYMTDGIMQREILLDPELNKYSVIMLDEAHERTIATDVLFSLLKKTLKKRPDMKLIVTSATLDAAKFSEYFNQCPILTIPGRTFPVEIMYSREPESDYLDAALTTVMQIHLTEPPGDILLFLTGKEEIDTSCEILYEQMKARPA